MLLRITRNASRPPRQRLRSSREVASDPPGLRSPLRRFPGPIRSAVPFALIITPPLALTPGTRLGVYEVTAQIGEGGMGEVYRVRDTKLDRDVAIKILPEAVRA